MKTVLPYIVLMLFLPFWSPAQTFSFKYFSVDDGLPSSYIYDIEQDNEGFIWIATEAGIAKYDGLEFDHNPIPEIEQEEIVNILLDSKGRLWFNKLNGQIIYIEDGNVYRLKPFTYERDGETFNAQILTIKEDKKGRIWLFNNSDIGYRLDSLSGNQVIHSKEYRFVDNASVIVDHIGDTTLLVGTKGAHFVHNDEFSFLPNKTPNDQKFVTNGFRFEDQIIFTSFTNVNAYDIKKNSFKTILDEYNDYFKKGTYDIYLDKNQNFWITTSDGILFLKKTLYGKYEFHHLLKGILIGQILEDKDGNLWFTTLREGLYFLPSDRIQVINQDVGLSGNRITSLAVNNRNEIIAGTDESYLNILSFNDYDSPNITHKIKLEDRAREVYDIVNYYSGDVWAFASSGIYELGQKQKKITNQTTRFHSFKVASMAPDSALWVGTSSIVYRHRDDINKILLRERTYALYAISYDEAWIGSVMGLYHYTTEDSTQLINLPELQTDIRGLNMDEDGNLWVATKSKGLYIYKDGKILHHLNQENGLPSNGCKKIFLEDKFAWLATNLGIAKINKNDYQIMVLGINDGLPSQEINDITKIGNKIVVATNKGIAYFNEDIKTNDSPPNLYIKSIRINEKDTSTLPRYYLDYNQNNIKLSFVALAYQSSKDIIYSIKMEGLDKEWLESGSGLAEYPSLSPGDYTLRVRTKTSGSEWSEEQSVVFCIKPPFWRTVWFIALTILLFFIFMSVLIRSIVNRIQRENEIQESLKESRLTALRSQMNPHFMFNSLNSIQEFILSKDKRAANKYLSRFSLLMRSILDMSDRNRITLEREIEALKLYLELESLRFDENIFYAIGLQEDLDTKEVTLPSMLVQPYVENAINHGLLHKKENRRLKIDFKLENNYLICEVDDNGIGREEAQNIQRNNRKTHQPKAMSVTEERLKLLNSAFEDELNVDIIDKKHIDGRSAGTKVIIYIEQRDS